MSPRRRKIAETCSKADWSAKKGSKKRTRYLRLRKEDLCGLGQVAKHRDVACHKERSRKVQKADWSVKEVCWKFLTGDVAAVREVNFFQVDKMRQRYTNVT